MDSTDPHVNGSHQVHSMADVESLIKRLYQPGSPQEVADTEKALQSLQRSLEGWQIANALLQSQDANVRFFGALTFTIKINQDWDSLGDNDATELLYRLVGWLIQLVKSEESALVLKKLCSALVAYLLRPSGPLEHSIRHLIVSFHEGHPIPLDQLSIHKSSISSMIVALNGLQANTILWFTRFLAEETTKVSGSSLQTYKYFEKISSSIQDVVDVLRYSIYISATQDLSLAENGLKCFHSWVMYAQRGWVDKGSELQALRPLAPLAMTALQHEQMYDAGTELFTDILNHFPAFLTDDDSRTLSLFLSNDDARNIVTRLKEGGFVQDTMSFAKLLLAYGEAFVQDLTQNPDNMQLNQILYQLLELLHGDGYADFEDDFCAQVLEFWTTYTEFVIDSLFCYEKDRPSWVKLAQKRIEGVIGVCWVKIQMPPPEIAVNWDSDVRANFKNFRKDVQDLLQSSYALLGMDIFDKFAQLALQSLNDHAWLPLEAALFCLNALADSVVEDGSVDGILSKLFGSTLFADMASPAEDIPAKTRQTAVIIISSYTVFFERNTEYLPEMLNFLFRSLKSPALAHVVARAIFSACSSCRETLTSELSAFLQQYEAVLTWESTDAHIKQKLIGAISAIIGALPQDEEKVAPLDQIIRSIEADVETCIRAARVRNTEEYQESGINALRCLVSMGKSLQAPDDVVINLEVEAHPSPFWTEGTGAPLQDRIIKILQTITALLKTNSDAVEAGCHILRIGHKEMSGGLFEFPLNISVDFILSLALDTARLEYVLDTAAICLARRASQAESAFVNAAYSFLNHLLGLITLMGYDPSAEPEVATSVINLMEYMVPQYFSSMMTIKNIQTLFDFVLKALTVPDIMPKRASANFWTTFVRRFELSEEEAKFQRAAIGRYGPLVCQILVNRTAGGGSRSELDESAELLKKLIFFQPSAKGWLSDALNSDHFPSQKVGPVEKRVWLQKLMSLRGTKGTNQVVKDFWIQCRGPQFSYTR